LERELERRDMSYSQKKGRARAEAIAWQSEFDNHNYSWIEMAEFGSHFEKIGKRFGLLKEFRGSGII